MRQSEWTDGELRLLLALLRGKGIRQIAEERKVRVGVVYALRSRLVQKLQKMIDEQA